jgi:hypothetical protein
MNDNKLTLLSKLSINLLHLQDNLEYLFIHDNFRLLALKDNYFFLTRI